MQLQDDLAQRISGCKSKARLNYFSAFVLLVVGVIYSAAATIAVATDSFTREANAVLAALPGIVVMIMNAFRFDARSDCWLD